VAKNVEKKRETENL